MAFQVWLAFVVTATVVLVIPGPTVALVIAYALGEGRRAAWATVAGVALGDFVAMTASLLGLGTLLAASAAVFTLLKWLGAAYLVWLGIRLWRAPAPAAGAGLPTTARSRRSIFGHAFAVTALNPKSILFFVAFVPQFIDPAAPALAQMVVLEATFVTLAALNTAAYALLAGQVRRAIRRPAVQTAVRRTGGTVLIGAGVATALNRGS